MTLPEFLLARIAEDEAVASRSASVFLIANIDRCKQVHSEEWYTFKHHERWGPRRVLAECEAKRKIVAHLADAERGVARAARLVEREGGSRDAQEAEFAADAKLDAVLCIAKHVAEIYADHTDYRDEWKL